MDLRRPTAFVVGVASVGSLVLLGFAGGLLWSRSRSSQRVAELEKELSVNEAEWPELADKLEAMEANYQRLRRAMGNDVAASGGGVALPPVEKGASVGQELGRVPNGPWVWPLAQRGFVTRSFGFRPDAAEGGHPGLDIAVPTGSYVRAAARGVVSETRRDSVYGLYVRIAHEDGFSSLYAHNSWVFVSAGDTVDRLEVIALSGNTGRSTAPHLHLEVARDGKRVDPLRYVPAGQ